MERKKIVYLIPGVGADESVFKFLQFPKEFEIKHVKWVAHKHYEEPLSEYVKRLKPQFDTKHDIYLCGLSFGGIVCSELAKILPVKKVILISSIKNKYERPIRATILKYLQFYRFFPSKILTKINFWHRWAFGRLTAEERKLIDSMIVKIDIKFNEWAVHQAIIWNNTETVKNLVHIHGDADKIFPILYVKNCYKIKGGTHFMVVNKAKPISNIIQKVLQKELALELEMADL